MKSARFRLASVVALIAILAIDCGWFRAIYAGRGSALGLGPGDFGTLDLGALVMLNILAVVFLVGRGRRTPFLRGFELAGISAVVAYVLLCWLFPRSFAYDCVVVGIQRIHGSFLAHLPTWVPGFKRDRLYPPFILVPLTFLYSLALTLPLLVIAAAGGFVSRWLGSRDTASAAGR